MIITKLSVSPGCKRLRFFLHNGKEHLKVKKYTISAALKKLKPVHNPTRPRIYRNILILLYVMKMTCLQFIIYNYFKYLQMLLKYLAKKTIHQWCNGPFSNLQSRHGPYWVHPGWLWIFINQFHEIFRENDFRKWYYYN